MVIAVENTSERHIFTLRAFPSPRSISPNDVKCGSSFVGREIDIGHQLEMLVPVVLMQTDGVHLLGSVNQIGSVRLSCTTAVLGRGRKA